MKRKRDFASWICDPLNSDLVALLFAVIIVLWFALFTWGEV